jgi:hypothetical protein
MAKGKKPADKKDMLKELTNTISPILVVNNSSLKPYVELFEYSPENIYQQPLGSLVGFFEVREYSEDSAYIVNFLTSVLKKEYYVNPKRPVNESLDSALHKVNMALSELAKQGNVEWLGNLHAAICVLEKNNAHFSVAGSAKLFLYRNRMLSDIAGGLTSDSPEPHPLKTFVNVSSGRLEKGDRILITSEDIFQILSITDLRKNFQRFESDKFVQFLKTALSNQLEMIASVVVEMKETKSVKETKITASKKKSAVAVNVFSEKAFAKAQPAAKSAQTEPGDDEIAAADQESEAEYTDEKTGHIYVQGETNEAGESGQANIYWDITKEKIAQVWYSSKNEMRRRFSLWRKQLAKKREIIRTEKEKQKQLAAEEKKREQELRAQELKVQGLQALEDMEREQQISLEKEHRLKIEEERQQEEERQNQQRLAEQAQLRQKREAEIAASRQQMQAVMAQQKTAAAEQQDDPTTTRGLSFQEKLALARKQYADVINLRQGAPTEQMPTPMETDKEESFPADQKTALEMAAASARRLMQKTMESLMPHFSKMRGLYAAFTSKQKTYAFAALVLVFVAPLFIVHWMNRPKPQTIAQLATVAPPTPSEIMAGEKNIRLAPQQQTVLPGSGVEITLATGSGTAAIKKTGIVMLGGGEPKEYPLPADSGAVVRAAFMQDLALVFLLTDQKKVLSFSPVTMKYAANDISLPAASSADLIGTYLTYLYVLDGKSNQIYRYPRATGGFGAQTNWLKDTATLAQVSDMTIDDSIYIIQNNQVLKFFKGKAQPLTLEVSRTPVHFDKIFTTVDSGSLYVLDAKNSRIVQYGKTDGAITAQYFDKTLESGTSLSVDEPNRAAYVSTPSALISISLQ